MPAGSPAGASTLMLHALGLHDPLTGSALEFDGKTLGGGGVSFWSRSAQSHFSGGQRTLGLSGEVRTTHGPGRLRAVAPDGRAVVFSQQRSG